MASKPKTEPEQGTTNGAETEVTVKTTTTANAQPAGFSEYIVYTFSAGMNPPATNTLTEIGRVYARNATDAIKGKNNGAGTYAAVAAGYLTVKTVKVETVEKLSLS